MQLKKSFRPIIKHLQPDLVLVLGDLFDEGGKASGEAWAVSCALAHSENAPVQYSYHVYITLSLGIRFAL